MFRSRVILLSTGLVIAAFLVHSQAQGPGGGGGGGRGGPGGGGRGGRGGFGPSRSDSALRLLSRTPVQEELKLTDDQKTKITELTEAVNKKRQDLFPRGNRGRGNNGGGGGNNGGGNNGGGNGAAGGNNAQANNANPGGGAGGNGGGGAGTAGNGGQTKGRRGFGGGGQGGGPGGGGPGGGPGGGGFGGGGFGGGGFGGGPGGGGFGGFPGGGPGGNGGPGPDFAAMRTAMQALDAQTDKELGKILTKPQTQRIAQIQLQQEGDFAVTKPDIQLKLNIGPDQSEQIAAILDESNQARRSMFTNQGQNSMFSMFQTPDGRFDFNAMRAKMDSDPKFKAQVDQDRQKQQLQRESLQNQTLQQIGRILTKKQKTNFQKMKGPPFDLAKLDRNYDPNADPNATTKAATPAATGKTASTNSAAKTSTAKSSTPTKSTSSSTSSSTAKSGAIKSNAKSGAIKSNTKGITRSAR